MLDLSRRICVDEPGSRKVSAKPRVDAPTVISVREPEARERPEPPLPRWSWMPLLVGSTVIVGLAMVLSELYLAAAGRTGDPWLRNFLVGRGVVVSALLALYAGWYIWRSRARIEAAREALRARAEELREHEQRVAQRFAMNAATRILAHEIRNPLNNMLLNCVVLERAAGDGSEACERVRQVCQVLRGEIERLSELSEGYLSGRRIEMRLEDVVLEALAADVVDVYRPEIEARRLRVDVVGERTVVNADPGRLRQLVHNLVRNALDAVAGQGRVRILCSRAGGQATLVVVDDGPGFADLDRAFRLFHTTKEHGTGLGLAVVRDIALLHGGQVEAANDESGGARVTVRLPSGGTP